MYSPVVLVAAVYFNSMLPFLMLVSGHCLISPCGTKNLAKDLTIILHMSKSSSFPWPSFRPSTYVDYPHMADSTGSTWLFPWTSLMGLGTLTNALILSYFSLACLHPHFPSSSLLSFSASERAEKVSVPSNKYD